MAENGENSNCNGKYIYNEVGIRKEIKSEPISFVVPG